jgi:hypothetical protein
MLVYQRVTLANVSPDLYTLTYPDYSIYSIGGLPQNARDKISENCPFELALPFDRVVAKINIPGEMIGPVQRDRQR